MSRTITIFMGIKNIFEQFKCCCFFFFFFQFREQSLDRVHLCCYVSVEVVLLKKFIHFVY